MTEFRILTQTRPGLVWTRQMSVAIGLGLGACLLGACTGMPDRVTPVSDFDVERYLGQSCR
jgi:hypothetical protein